MPASPFRSRTTVRLPFDRNLWKDPIFNPTLLERTISRKSRPGWAIPIRWSLPKKHWMPICNTSGKFRLHPLSGTLSTQVMSDMLDCNLHHFSLSLSLSARAIWWRLSFVSSLITSLTYFNTTTLNQIESCCCRRWWYAIWMHRLVA